MTRRRLAALITLAALSPLAAARAQYLEGTIAGQQVTHRFSEAGPPQQQSGVYLGGAVLVGVGPARLGLAGAFGQLSGPGTAGSDRNVRSTTASFGIAATPWLVVGLEAVARRTTTDTSTTLHRLGGAYARLTTTFGGQLEGVADLAFYPVSDVTNAEPVRLSQRASISVRYAPSGGPIVMGLGYRLFRIDHEAGPGGTRLDQDQSIVLELSLRRPDR